MATTREAVGGAAERVAHRLVSADKVEGTAVYDRSGNRVGTIEEIMIDKITGKVAYAVMSFGGFLGIGDRYHPLPWSVLTYDAQLGGYKVDLPPDQLKRAPTYGAKDRVDLNDRTYGRGIYDYYGTKPYWDEDR